MITYEGKEVIPALYDDVLSFENGYASVLKDDKWGIVNTDGTLICDMVYDEIFDFDAEDGFAAVCKNDKWGFINTQGEEITPIQYDECEAFVNGFAAVCKDDLWGFVNTEGKEVFPLEYDEVEDFHDENFALAAKGDEVFVLFHDGHVVPYEELEKLSDERKN